MTRPQFPAFGPQGPGSRRRFFLIGNRLCIDFANTIYPPASGGALTCWGDLVAFFEAVGVLGPAHREHLTELETSAPDATAAAFRSALELRDAFRKTLEAIASGRSVLAAWVEPVNAVLRWTEGYDQLVPTGHPDQPWRLELVVREHRLEWLLAAIARSAADLVAEGPGAPVRKCASPACLLYFYDTSRTGRRRWCSMSVCGNRTKVAAHARHLRARALRRKKKPGANRE